jgi:hypothetical protein
MKVNGLILLGFNWSSATEGSSQAYDEGSIPFTRSKPFSLIYQTDSRSRFSAKCECPNQTLYRQLSTGYYPLNLMNTKVPNPVLM